MAGPEEIFHNKKKIAVVFRHSMNVNGVRFFTPEDNPFQIGIHGRKKGVKLAPHVHLLDHPLTISTIQEVLFILSGKLRITLYSKDGTLIAKKILVSGDSILLMEEGHGVDFLEDSRIFEIKQGPYPGTTHAKLYFQPHST